MIDKIASRIEVALHGIQDGATIMIGGFGSAGIPDELKPPIITVAPSWMPCSATSMLLAILSIMGGSENGGAQ